MITFEVNKRLSLNAGSKTVTRALRTPKKQIAIILENAGIHKSRKVEKYLKRHQNIHLFYLPTYSPEYNPVEFFWKWIKPKVYGFSAIGGIAELVSQV